MRRTARLALPLALLVVAGSASAHDADILYAQLWRPEASGPEVRERLTLTADSLALLIPADADGDGALTQADLDARAPALAVGIWDSIPLSAGGQPCTRTGTSARVRESFVELSATFQCAPGELRQRFSLLSVLPSNYKVVLGSYIQGEQGQRFADASQPTLVVSEPGQPDRERISGMLDWVGLGLVHIFGGIDHLAFLLALLLVGGSFRRVLLLVTAFTVAHSLTLGATALGFILLDDARTRWVEAAIAASIIWVALENLVLREHRHRALLTFLFGLIHGFGFASVLGSYGLGDSVVTGLFGFNLGVELGQAAVVALLLPIVRLVQRRPVLHSRTVRALSLLILAAGGYWLMERALGPIG
ncbi:HupE/UreJ family protein [Archangium lansingense]|uniref:HupE/UreJ family protein n=1 Tax=Archangium lansingense TaxID=2995310 RepID=A0ABT4A7Y5_9BACT|nr:HupE/UreJ family protein [Archangium lansinium]MCY1077776.1 HupE/UreJ family protein [Archangium lansinium]